jgi:aspartokinase
MHDACSGKKIKIGGIKLSPELAQFNLFSGMAAGLPLTSVLRRLAQDRINVTFLCLSCSTDDAKTDAKTDSIGSFCVSADDFPRVKQIVDAEAGACHQVEILASIGTITLFPHHHSFVLLGGVLGALAKAGIPIHAVCTSLSSLAINTEYRFLDRAVEELEKILDLPVNHAPFRPELDLTAGQ